LTRTHTVHCKDEHATAALVHDLARGINAFYIQATKDAASKPFLHISLQGDLGSGKTTATRYLLKELGYSGRVKSPTYGLCEEHSIPLSSLLSYSLSPNQEVKVFHFDLYRMQTPTEWQEAGLAEHFAKQDHPTLCIVEWPEKAQGTLPKMDLEITLSHSPFGSSELARNVQFQAQTASGEFILRSLNQSSS
jgi:tRNA threonylcarbamoyladenosine biosynthesis protein TsaE